MNDKATKRNEEKRRKAISYHPALADSYDAWAEAAGWPPKELKQATETAVRSRDIDATVEHEVFRVDANEDVFWLSLGSVDVYYSEDGDVITIRGYGWEIHGEPLDDWDGGGFYASKKGCGVAGKED